MRQLIGKTRKVWFALVMIGLASQARAQGPVVAGVAPVIDGGVGYTYMKATIPGEGNLAMKGILMSASGDLNAHFGAKLELGYSRSFDAFQTGRNADILTYMAGPVFYPIRRPSFSVHVQLLGGGARETGVNFESDGTLVRGYVNHFAWAGGAGFQFQVSPALALRPEVEYIRTSYFDSNVAIKGQPNMRASLSMVYTFGRRR